MAKKPAKQEKPSKQDKPAKVEKAGKVKKEAEVVEKPAKAAKPSAPTVSTSKNSIVDQLDKLLEAELSGVVRYMHYSFMIFGPNRIPITKWFRDQASEGMVHAVTIGEKITALGGHPSVKVQPVPETKTHNVIELLKESLSFEKATIELYKDLLGAIGEDVALDEMIRGLILEETLHIEEVEKMCRSYKE